MIKVLDLMVFLQICLKVFWNKIGHFIVRSINYAFNEGNLSITQKQGIITCIPKDKKTLKVLKKLATYFTLKYYLQTSFWFYSKKVEICFRYFNKQGSDGFC
jgi:hypothetical protein